MLPRGQIFYDASCGLCSASYKRFGPMTERRGFHWVPLQEPRARTLLNLEGDEMPSELQMFTRTGKHKAGVNALLYVAKHVWWLWPIYAVSKVPLVRPTMRVAYRWVAKHRHAISGACKFHPQLPRSESSKRHVA